jgi:phosphate:Na+ symporter
LEVLLKETNHLFDICFEAIAHGMGLSRASMLDKKKMKTISKAGAIEYYDANVDEIYYNRIKNIYGEIVKFGTRAQTKYGEVKYVNAINSVLEANRYFVEVVKDIKDLQPNILKYCDSENEVLRNEYNRLRKRIAKFIRIVFYYQDFKIVKPEHIMDASKIMDKINKERGLLQNYIDNSKKHDVLYNGGISQLIIDKKLTGPMVTSLINDSRIVNSINKHLVKASALLYLNTDVLIRDHPDE